MRISSIHSDAGHYGQKNNTNSYSANGCVFSIDFHSVSIVSALSWTNTLCNQSSTIATIKKKYEAIIKQNRNTLQRNGYTYLKHILWLRDASSDGNEVECFWPYFHIVRIKIIFLYFIFDPNSMLQVPFGCFFWFKSWLWLHHPQFWRDEEKSPIDTKTNCAPLTNNEYTF